MEKLTIILVSLFVSLASCSQVQQESTLEDNEKRTEKDTGSLLPKSFNAPDSLVLEHFVLLPLGSDFCDLDYAAISSNIDYLKGTFGPNTDWPEGITYEDNFEELKIHEELFEEKLSFAYSVFSPDRSKIIGCVYITPLSTKKYDASVTFWLTEEAYDSGLDTLLLYSMKLWLKEEWPFKSVAFPGRD